MMRSLFFILVVVVGFGCNNTDNENQKTFLVSETVIDTKGIVERKKSLDYGNRFQLVQIQGKDFLVNLSKEKKILLFDLQTGEVKEQIFEGLPAMGEIDAIRYDADSIDLIVDNNLYTGNYNDSKVDSVYPVPLATNEFIIHNMYSPTIYRYNDYHFVQYGNEDNNNRIDSSALLFFNKYGSVRRFEYPEEFSSHYIHYNDMCMDYREDTFYYTFATHPGIFKSSFDGLQRSSKKLDDDGFLKYDTTKLTDMKYVYDYTHKTKYNVKLLCGDKYVFLVQRQLKNKNAAFHLLVFDNGLNIVEDREIDHTVDPNFIFLRNDDLVFISTKDKKQYVYEFH